MNTPRLLARTAAVLFATFLAAIMTLSAAPAQAHDSLESSNPADGDELDTAPGWLEMQFSADIGEVGNEVVVMYEGQDVSAGEITVDGSKVTSALPDDLGAGEYTVQWRVVSSDGHPISGEYTFTLTDAAAAGEDEGESTEGAGLGGEAIDNPEAEVPERGALGDSDADSSGLSVPTILLISVGALSVLVAVVVIVMRKTKAIDAAEKRDAPSKDAGKD